MANEVGRAQSGVPNLKSDVAEKVASIFKEAESSSIAYQMGQDAFKAGKPAAPAANAELMALVEDAAVGEGNAIQLFKDYSKGWHDANLAAPVASKTAADENAGMRRHKLLTAELRRALPSLYSQENNPDPMCVVKFFSPYSGWKWYACVTSDTPILCSDLIYRPAKELAVGDELVGFDENTDEGPRRHRTATVTNTAPAEKRCVRVETSDGTVDVTYDHPFLVSTAKWKTDSKPPLDPERKSPRWHRWVNAEDLDPGYDKIVSIGEAWDTPDSYQAGYLGGILDGEGCVTTAAGKVGISQKFGFVYQEIERILKEEDVPFSVYPQTNAQGFNLLGGFPASLHILGRFQPKRLIAKKHWEGRHVKHMPKADVISVTDIGVQSIVQLETSTGTFIANGLYSHNTEFDGTDRFFGWVQGFDGELGYFSLSELEGLTINGVPGVERDLYWTPKPLSEVKSGRAASKSASKEENGFVALWKGDYGFQFDNIDAQVTCPTCKISMSANEEIVARHLVLSPPCMDFFDKTAKKEAVAPWPENDTCNECIGTGNCAYCGGRMNGKSCEKCNDGVCGLCNGDGRGTEGDNATPRRRASIKTAETWKEYSDKRSQEEGGGPWYISSGVAQAGGAVSDGYMQIEWAASVEEAAANNFDWGFDRYAREFYKLDEDNFNSFDDYGEDRTERPMQGEEIFLGGRKATDSEVEEWLKGRGWTASKTAQATKKVTVYLNSFPWPDDLSTSFDAIDPKSPKFDPKSKEWHDRLFRVSRDGYRPGDPLKLAIQYEMPAEMTDAAICEDAFHEFNVGSGPRANEYRNGRNRSLSIGDVVVVNGTAYNCASSGFTLVNGFTASKTASVDPRDLLLLPDSVWRDAYDDWQGAKYRAMEYVTEAPSREEALLRLNAVLNAIANADMDAMDLQAETVDELESLGIDWDSSWNDERTKAENFVEKTSNKKEAVGRGVDSDQKCLECSEVIYPGSQGSLEDAVLQHYRNKHNRPFGKQADSQGWKWRAVIIADEASHAESAEVWDTAFQCESYAKGYGQPVFIQRSKDGVTWETDHVFDPRPQEPLVSFGGKTAGRFLVYSDDTDSIIAEGDDLQQVVSEAYNLGYTTGYVTNQNGGSSDLKGLIDTLYPGEYNDPGYEDEADAYLAKAKVGGLDKMALSRKDYVAIADIISKYETKAAIAGALADYFASDNPAFDRQRFLDATGA